VSVGQWLPRDFEFLTDKTTILWTNAGYPELFPNQDGMNHTIFVEAPQITALSCKMILEAASASVTVNVADNSVQSFNL
jgi:hypothetical protein